MSFLTRHPNQRSLQTKLLEVIGKMKKLMTKATKLVITSICLIGFLINSFATIQAFLKGAKILSKSQNTKYDQAGLQMTLPTVVICKERIIQDQYIVRYSEEYLYTFEEYEKSWDVVHKSNLIAVVTPEIFKDVLNQSQIYTMDKLYTSEYGACLAISIKKPVRNH